MIARQRKMECVAGQSWLQFADRASSMQFVVMALRQLACRHLHPRFTDISFDCHSRPSLRTSTGARRIFYREGRQESESIEESKRRNANAVGSEEWRHNLSPVYGYGAMPRIFFIPAIRSRPIGRDTKFTVYFLCVCFCIYVRLRISQPGLYGSAWNFAWRFGLISDRFSPIQRDSFSDGRVLCVNRGYMAGYAPCWVYLCAFWKYKMVSKYSNQRQYQLSTFHERTTALSCPGLRVSMRTSSTIFA